MQISHLDKITSATCSMWQDDFFNDCSKINEKIELNLNNPIFVYSVDVSGMTRQRADREMEIIKHSFDVYSNITIWVIASNKNSIECVYDGNCKDRSSEKNYSKDDI